MNSLEPCYCPTLVNLFYGLLFLMGIYGYIEMAVIAGADGAFGFDKPLLEFLQTYRTSYFDMFFMIVTWLGSRFLLLPLSLVILVFLLCYRYRAEALFLSLAVGGTILSTIVTKLVVARGRPDLFPSLIELPVSFSFPSAHASQATAFYLALFLIVRRLWPHRQGVWAVILILLTLLVVISRVYLQVHYPSDVLGGLTLGGIWVLGVYGFSVTIHQLSSPSADRRGI